LDVEIWEEEERKKREAEERETVGQALVEAANGGKLLEITSLLSRPDAQDLINYMWKPLKPIPDQSSRCIYAASSVWWAARHGHFKTLEALIAAGADLNLAPRVLHDAVPASVRIVGAVGKKGTLLNGVYEAAIDVDSYVQLNGKPVLRKRDDPDTWIFLNTDNLWVIGTTADKEANGKSCLCKGWQSDSEVQSKSSEDIADSEVQSKSSEEEGNCEKCGITVDKGTTDTNQCAGNVDVSCPFFTLPTYPRFA
jgi:hypothetical protein